MHSLSIQIFIVHLLLVLLPAHQVSAHGFVHAVSIDGKEYTGNAPNANANPSIIRQVNDVSAVKGSSNPDLNCGLSAQLASVVVDANPGSVVEFDWRGGDLSNWPHNTGPMLTYMTNCGSTTCDKFDSTNAKWFKIDQVAKGSNGNWVQGELMQGGVAKITIPATLKAGNYIIRHEIIALHLAVTRGNAEFYPSCAQLRVGGTGTAVPSEDELVTFPGGYHDDDPGVYVPGIYDNNLNYVFPGPPLAQLSGSSSSPAPSSQASSPPQTNSPQNTNMIPSPSQSTRSTANASQSPSSTNTNTSPSPSASLITHTNTVQCRLVSRKARPSNELQRRNRQARGVVNAAWFERSLRALGFW